MSRGINALTKAELLKDSFRLASLIQFDFSTVIKITDYGATITHATHGTFTPSSHVIEVGETAETSGLKVNSFNLVFSSVDQAFSNLFLYDDYMGVQVKIWRATLDASDNIVGDPWYFFVGRITGFTISDSDSSRLTIELASHWKDFQKVNGRRTNTESQARYFPNDTGFRFAPVATDNVKWGKI